MRGGLNPLAVWIYRETGDSDLMVTDEDMYKSREGPIRKLVKHMPEMRKFITKFHEGEFPELEEEELS